MNNLKLELEIEKLQELKVLLSHEIITYKEYLEYLQVNFKRGQK